MGDVAMASSALPPLRCVFCSHCGAIMDEPTFVGTDVDCRVCGTTVRASVFKELVLHSAGAEHLVESEVRTFSLLKKCICSCAQF